jgi:hypothetical protein
LCIIAAPRREVQQKQAKVGKIELKQDTAEKDNSNRNRNLRFLGVSL